MKMKLYVASAMALLTLGSVVPMSHAGDMGEASGIVAGGALSLAAAPLLIVGGTVVGASEATVGIVKLVNGAGESLADLTLDALQDVTVNTNDAVTELNCRKPCTVNVTINQTKKEIPLVVRKEYVQMNQKVEQ